MKATGALTRMRKSTVARSYLGLAVQAEHDVHRKPDAPVPQGPKLALVILDLVVFLVDGLEAFRADGLHADIYVVGSRSGPGGPGVLGRPPRWPWPDTHN